MISPLERKERNQRFWGLLPAMLIIGIFMVIPMGIVAVYSFLEADSTGGVESQFSLDAYQQFLFELDLDDSLIFNAGYLRIFGRSFLLAFVCTILCLLIGFPVAYYMSRQPAEQKNMLVMLVTIPFWTNLLIRTYCWVLLLRDNGHYQRTYSSSLYLDCYIDWSGLHVFAFYDFADVCHPGKTGWKITRGCS
jgi:spermidine/putrescine transport system permease protein